MALRPKHLAVIIREVLSLSSVMVRRDSSQTVETLRSFDFLPDEMTELLFHSIDLVDVTSYLIKIEKPDRI